MPFDINGQILTNLQIKNYNEKNIVRNGLVLYLDAGMSSSYPGSGTTWYDLSGNSGNATLVNGPTYSTTYGGGITTDGSNDYIELPTTGLNSNADFTLEIAFKKLTATGNRNIFGGLSIGHLTIRSYLASNYYTGLIRGDQAELGNFGASSSTVDDTNYVLTLSLNKATTTFSLYLNGVFINTLNPGNQTFTTTAPILGKHLCCYEFTSTTYYGLKWYNRQLTSSEVLQNYNANRRRFNIG